MFDKWGQAAGEALQNLMMNKNRDAEEAQKMAQYAKAEMLKAEREQLRQQLEFEKAKRLAQQNLSQHPTAPQYPTMPIIGGRQSGKSANIELLRKLISSGQVNVNDEEMMKKLAALMDLDFDGVKPEVVPPPVDPLRDVIEQEVSRLRR